MLATWRTGPSPPYHLYRSIFRVKKITAVCLAFCLPVLLSGCLTNAEEQQQRAENIMNMVPCPAHRPVMCGDEIEPVCGVFSNGTTWDYHSSCLACARNVIMGYIPGSCRQIGMKTKPAE